MSGVVIGIVVLCLLVAIGIAVYFIIKKRGSSGGGAPQVVDIPQEMRTSSRAWGSTSADQKTHNRGRLDSPQAWSADGNYVGCWYQMDNGMFANVYGVVIKGRADGDQWVKTFTVKYRQNNIWKSVDGGAIFTGSEDRNTDVQVLFSAPVNARYIRIYPQTWQGHISLRAGLVVDQTVTTTNYGLLDIPGANRDASGWWSTNDSAAWHPNKGTLNSGSGWHPRSDTASDGSVWYEMKLDGAGRNIAGVAIQGRGDRGQQWITEFTAKYKNANNQWVDVDGGFIFTGCGDNDTIVWAFFNAPVGAKSIRVYPKKWHRWFSGRFDLIGF